MKWTPVLDYTPEIFDAVEKFSTEAMKPAVKISAKSERNAAVDAVTADAVDHFCGDDGEFPGQNKMVKEAVRSLMKKVMRRRVLDEGIRIDGRKPADLREITAEVGVLPTAHGSGLFQRGETQVMNVLTLAMPRMNQMIDSLNPNNEKRYLHHYNMPPWANGETGRVGSPKRREIGHGALAARAVLPVIPNQEDFAYTLRLVSEVMASNGSTSMGSVCSSSLSLMDAGVPVRSHVSGIAMGLIYEDGKYVTLTDILGAEDAMGDMDFKVAGTEDAITALQLDTKIDGIPADVLSEALAQARVARLEILDVMNECLPATRDEIAETAPKISTIYIPMDKIGEVIGPKGKIINTIQQETGADIGVDDDGARGIVTIGAVEAWRMEEAKTAILNIVDPPKAELGEVYMGRVVNITKFGAFVNILPGRDGLVHISKMGGGKRINAVEDVLELGQPIEVKVDEIDDKGKVSLTPTSPLGGGDGGGGSSDSGSSDDAPKRERAPRRDREERTEAPEASGDSDIETVSFEDSFDADLEADLGDLGPKSERPKADRDNGNRRGGGGKRRRRQPSTPPLTSSGDVPGTSPLLWAVLIASCGEDGPSSFSRTLPACELASMEQRVRWVEPCAQRSTPTRTSHSSQRSIVTPTVPLRATAWRCRPSCMRSLMHSATSWSTSPLPKPLVCRFRGSACTGSTPSWVRPGSTTTTSRSSSRRSVRPVGKGTGRTV